MPTTTPIAVTSETAIAEARTISALRRGKETTAAGPTWTLVSSLEVAEATCDRVGQSQRYRPPPSPWPRPAKPGTRGRGTASTPSRHAKGQPAGHPPNWAMTPVSLRRSGCPGRACSGCFDLDVHQCRGWGADAGSVEFGVSKTAFWGPITKRPVEFVPAVADLDPARQPESATTPQAATSPACLRPIRLPSRAPSPATSA